MIHELWQRLESWGQANSPAMLEDLNPGADHADVVSLQDSLGIELPTSFVESLKIHNGENDGWPYKAFAGHGAYLSIENILKNWSLRKQVAFEMAAYKEELQEREIEVEGPVKPVSFSPKWVPFMDCNSDIFWAMDFDPQEGGVIGQIIEVDFEGASWRVVADSFERFFHGYVSSLEASNN